MSGRDRNKLCYCGSGQKYKKCHLLIDQHIDSGKVKKIQIHELQQIFNETLHREFCAGKELKTPRECSEKIINAHTLTRSLSLDKIAKNGHIYAFKNKDLFSFIKSNGVVKFQKIGVRIASTFRGFCSYHDDYLFSSIEKENFILSTEQILALFFRSFALEYYKKKNVLENARKTFQPLIRNTHKTRFDLRTEAIVANLKRAKLDLQDNLKIKDKIVASFNSGITNSIKTYAIKIMGDLPFVCTGLFALYRDISNNILQDIYNYELEVIEYINLNIFYAQDGCSWIVINWFEDDNLINDFILDLKSYSIHEQINIIANMMILYTENAYFSIDYIDNLSIQRRGNLEKNFNESLNGNFISLRQNNFNFNNFKYEVFEK